MKKIARNKKSRLGRLPLKKPLRIGIIVILAIITLFSMVNTITAFQQPTIIEKSTTTGTYRLSGEFGYVAHLKENIVYNKTILYPNQGIIFRKITEHINGSFTCRFINNEETSIQGYYTLKATLQTDMWNKEYTLIPETMFQSGSFSLCFPINYQHYEGIFTVITNEIGVRANSPKLVITCDIAITAQTSQRRIQESFSPSINVPLNTDVFEIQGSLLQSKDGVLTERTEIFREEVVEQRNNGILQTITFFICIPLVFLITKNELVTITKMETQVKKLNKKYGEWIAEVEAPPVLRDAKTIPMKSMEDLAKISEELGKPLIYYKSSDPETKHLYYVLDDSNNFSYSLKPGEKITKITQCPDCSTKITYEAHPDESTYVTCPECGNKGIIKPKQISNRSQKIVGWRIRKRQSPN